MRIAIVGLSLSHPYTFAKILGRCRHTVAAVWDYSGEKAAEFAKEHGCDVLGSPDEIPDRKVDGALVTSIASDHARFAAPLLEAGVPTFVDKAMATNPADVAAMLRAARTSGTPLMSCSVLRYAPAFLALRDQVQSGAVGVATALRALVLHGITGYLEPGNTWQDEPDRGGGSIINMGVHGLDPMQLVAGPGLRTVWCAAEKRHLLASQSEDTALLSLRWDNGLLGVVELMCGTKAHGYYLDVYGSEACLSAAAPSLLLTDLAGHGHPARGAEHEYGYEGTLLAFLDSIERGHPAIPLEHTEEVMLGLMAARRSAAEGRPVELSELREG